LSQISIGKGNLYDNFVREINNQYEEIRHIYPHMEWTSLISMLYHHPKHSEEFDNPPVCIQDYFGKLSKKIFKRNNLTSEGYSQDGYMMKKVYTSRFELKKHVGYTIETDKTEKIASHYTKGIY